MNPSSLVRLALVVSHVSLILAQGGRHSSLNRMRHVVRSPALPAPPSGYDMCIEQCMARVDSSNSPSQVSSSSLTTAQTSLASPTLTAYGSLFSSLSMADSAGAGALATRVNTSLTTSLASSMTPAYGGGYGYGSPPSAAPLVPLPTSSGNLSLINATSPVVIVGPKMGDLRMVPFNINVPPGQNVTFVWGAGPHTVTQSSPLEICNASNTAGAFKSGMQLAGFEFPVHVSSNSTLTYFCNVPGHCQKGMFGLVNGLTVAVPEGSFGQAMPRMAANDTGLSGLWNETKAMCEHVPAAWSWGNNLSVSQFPDWALPAAMESILYTRQFLAAAANPGSLPAGSNSSSATTPASESSSSSTSGSDPISTQASRGSGGPPIETSSSSSSSSSRRDVDLFSRSTSSSLLVVSLFVVFVSFQL